MSDSSTAIQLDVKSERLRSYIRALLETGLYGVDENEVIVTIIQIGVARALKDGIIPHRDTKVDDRPRCTNCGSPNLAQGLTMGAGIECMDCGTAQ